MNVRPIALVSLILWCAICTVYVGFIVAGKGEWWHGALLTLGVVIIAWDSYVLLRPRPQT